MKASAWGNAKGEFNASSVFKYNDALSTICRLSEHKGLFLVWTQKI